MSDSDSDDFDPNEMRRVQELLAQREAEDGDGIVRKGDVEYIYHKEACKSKYDAIRTDEDWHWVETLVVPVPTSTELDNGDDVKRESFFYDQAVYAADVALKKLTSNNIPFTRPSDYYAEMIKPESHMNKVKKSLLLEQKKMAIVEARKKAQANRKFGKSIQTEKKMTRAKEKRAFMEQTAKERNAFKSKNGKKQNQLKIQKTDVRPLDDEKRGRKRGRESDKGGHVSDKRQRANDKYGFGGRKKNQKNNELEGGGLYSQGKGGRTFGRNKASKGKKNQRPGKNRRQANKR